MTAVNMTRVYRTRKSLALAGHVTSFFVHDGEAAPGWTAWRFPDREPDCQARHIDVLKTGRQQILGRILCPGVAMSRATDDFAPGADRTAHQFEGRGG